jgi:CubicO group peptidase (beta-lactamase class C family)
VLLGFGTVALELDPGHIDCSPVVELLERQRDAGLHDCAQCYVSLGGEVLLDVAVGETVPGRQLLTDDVMLWYSSGKPLTTAAVLQLWERGGIGLDDRVGDFLAGWAQGKERCTVRHVLTHTGGFPMYGSSDFDSDLPAEESLARIVATPAVWEPGTAAGYHPVTGWRVLGAIVEAVDGRPIDHYLHDEILRPLGCTSSSLGVPLDEQRRLGERLVPVAWKGHRFPVVEDDGGLRMLPYRIDEIHNEPWHIAKVEPGATMRGPARELGRFYESLLGYGPRVLDPATVELMGAVHRHDLRDALFGIAKPWGLGVTVDFSGGAGRRAYGHGGMASSRGLADPDCGLVMVVVCNGLPNPFAAEQRLLEVTDAVYTALGDVAVDLRRPLEGFGMPALST